VLGRRVIFFATEDDPVAPGCETVHWLRSGTNWQYACAGAVVAARQACQETGSSHEPDIDEILLRLRLERLVV
jgi:hypothetical protein